MLPSSSPQSTPQHKVQDFGSVLEGENRKIWFKSQSALCCVYKVWRKMFVSPCRIPQSFLVRAWSPSKNQKVQKKKQQTNITKQNKAPKRRKTVDSICQSSKGTQSEWWIYDLFLSLVCFPSCLLQTWESARTCETELYVCVCVESSFVYVNSFKIHMVPP